MAVDQFAGAGGWDEGLATLGIFPLGIEIDPDACATRAAAGHLTLQGDIAALDPSQFAPCDLQLGSPPCPTFSSAGDGLGRLLVDLIRECADEIGRGVDRRAEHRERAYDVLYPVVLAAEKAKARRKRRDVVLAKVETKARADAALSLLVVEPLRFAVAVRPTFVALEQVPAVLPLWRSFAGRILAEHGYRCWSGILNAADFGVPQTRKRAILIASLVGQPHPPEPTHIRGGVSNDVR